ncbi:MAG: D-alanine--D-alanine ligase [bacterium]
MKVLLLAGGDSSEREVSFTSGRAIYEALSGLGHSVHAIDPASGRSLIAGDGTYAKALPAPDQTGEEEPAGRALSRHLTESLDNIDVVFLGLHGGAGENGSIQNLLSLGGVAYTGSDMTASAVAMDKALTKRVCQSLDIATPEWRLYRVPDGRITPDLYAAISSKFQPPYIVKPNDGGSTVGLTKVATPDQLTPALLEVIGETKNILVEEYIAGRELTVAVLDGHAFPPVEIKPRSGLYDYHAKYTAGASEYICPAEVPEAVATQAQASAVRLYEAIGAAGLARIDFLMDRNERLFCLEINTLPGMTPLSLAPMAAKAEGINFEQLVSMIVKSALKRRTD